MAGEVHGTLVPNTKASLTVTPLPDRIRGVRELDMEVRSVIVSNFTASPIYYTTDGVDPTIGGIDTHVVAPGGFRETEVTSTESQVVEAIGASAGPWSVEAVSGAI